MPHRDIRTREALAGQGIVIPADLAAWARRHGLLGVYIVYLPRSALPACWQVIRPGHRTDHTGPGWQRGNKTFLVRSVADKHRCEQAAASWSAAHFGVPQWVRIEGLGNALFPAPVAEELARYLPDLTVYRHRQHAPKGTASS